LVVAAQAHPATGFSSPFLYLGDVMAVFDRKSLFGPSNGIFAPMDLISGSLFGK
jgi:hypothetical protein